nr:MAG: hypothetical protein [Marsupenaeus japonicus endogenous nimavirus]
MEFYNITDNDTASPCKFKPDLCMNYCVSYPNLPVICKHFPTLYTGYNDYLIDMYGDDKTSCSDMSDDSNKSNVYLKHPDGDNVNSCGSITTNDDDDSTTVTPSLSNRDTPLYFSKDKFDKNNLLQTARTSKTTEKVTMDSLLSPVLWSCIKEKTNYNNN